ncbi:MAG: ABC transporter permease [Clostridiaceae bacterium]|nr:ABC transporter permease [Clostridiaceae bacterium]
MKNYLSLSTRYALRRPRSTIAIMLGVILSTAILTSIVTIQETYRVYVIQKSEEEYGNYHAAYVLPRQDVVDKVKNNVLVKDAGITCEIAGERLENGIYMNKVAVGKEAWKLCGIQLVAGSRPVKEGECLIEEWAAKELKIEGFPANLNGSVVTGIIKSKQRSLRNYSTLAVYDMDGSHSLIKHDGKKSLLVRFKEGVDISYGISALSAIKGLESAKMNRNLPEDDIDKEYSTMQYSLWLIGLIISIIVLLAVFMSIFSIMNLSVLDRIQQYGILRAVGLNPGQLIWIVLLEALFICLIAIPLGIMAGLGISWIGVGRLIFLPEGGIGIAINIGNMILCVIFCVLAVFASSILPAVKAAKITPLMAIAGDTGVVANESSFSPGARQQRLIKAFGKVGFIIGMAYRNLWRRKFKLLLSVVSLSFAVVILMVYSFLTQSERASNEGRKDEYTPDFIISRDFKDFTAVLDVNNVKEEIFNLDGVKNFYSVGYLDGIGLDNIPHYTMMFRKDALADEYLRFQKHCIHEDNNENGLIGYSGFAIYSYTSKELAVAEKYLLEGKIDEDSMLKNNEILIPRYVTTIARNIRYTTLEPGDEIELVLFDIRNSENKKRFKFRIGGVLDCAPYCPYNVNDGFFVIMHPEVLKDLLEEYAPGSLAYSIYIDMDENASIYFLYNELKQIVSKYSGYDVYYGKKHIKNEIELQKSYRQADQIAYGILACIAFIVMLNIVNTISTKLIARMREFGMLKSVGMSPGQLKGLILAECLFYGILSWILGTGIGLLLNYIFYLMLSKNHNVVWVTPWREMYAAFGVCITGCLLASIFPIRRMMRIHTVEAIRAID